jgi:D-alanine transfer protein
MPFSSLRLKATSEDEHYAVYNYFNQQLHKPVVAYGDAFVDDETQFYCSHVLKIALTQTVKLFYCWHLTAFTQKVCHAIYADNFPGSVFDP